MQAETVEGQGKIDSAVVHLLTRRLDTIQDMLTDIHTVYQRIKKDTSLTDTNGKKGWRHRSSKTVPFYGQRDLERTMDSDDDEDDITVEDISDSGIHYRDSNSHRRDDGPYKHHYQCCGCLLLF
jgi:hypothetical protein